MDAGVQHRRGNYTTTKKLVALWQESQSMSLSEPYRDVVAIVGRDDAERYKEYLVANDLEYGDWARGFINGVGDTWKRIGKEVERS